MYSDELKQSTVNRSYNERTYNKPNIILILCDQLRPFELGCYGHPVLETPNIDSMAETGVRFEYACTSNALCTPARSSLLSGQYSRTCTGILGNCYEPIRERAVFPNPILSEILQRNGYKTALIGKWHMEPEPCFVGFDNAIYPKMHHLNMNQDYYDIYRNHFRVTGFTPNFELRLLKDFLDSNHRSPFFMYYNISLPHMPFFDVPDFFKHKYSREQVLLRDNVHSEESLRDKDMWYKIYMYGYLYFMGILKECPLPKGFDIKDLTAIYYGMIDCVDWQLGKIFEMLKDSMYKDNTIVVFTSDHGDNLGSHGLFNKHEVFDESIRIPLIFHWNNRLKNGIRDNCVASLIDIAPTLLSLADIEIPAHMQGKDLSPALMDSQALGGKEAFIENVNGEIAVRTTNHMYSIVTSAQENTSTRWVETGKFFYDMREDIFQLQNLADGSEQKDIAHRLREMVLQWDKETPWMESFV
jgi:arylsulfatase A-like enzyme